MLIPLSPKKAFWQKGYLTLIRLGPRGSDLVSQSWPGLSDVSETSLPAQPNRELVTLHIIRLQAGPPSGCPIFATR